MSSPSTNTTVSFAPLARDNAKCPLLFDLEIIEVIELLNHHRRHLLLWFELEGRGTYSTIFVEGRGQLFFVFNNKETSVLDEA